MISETRLEGSSLIRLNDTITLSKAEAKSVECILGHDLEPIRLKLLDKGELDSAVIEGAILEYRKFFILLRLTQNLQLPDALAMTSAEVDAVWHTHILYTRNYMDFCERAFGNYIHHEPAVGSSISMDESLEIRYAFYDAYRRTFGELSPLWSIKLRSESVDGLIDALGKNSRVAETMHAAFPLFASLLIRAPALDSGHN